MDDYHRVNNNAESNCCYNAEFQALMVTPGLHCSDNNRADTVLALFLEACREYNVPSRIRCDYGVENVDVARW